MAKTKGICLNCVKNSYCEETKRGLDMRSCSEYIGAFELIRMKLELAHYKQLEAESALAKLEGEK